VSSVFIRGEICFLQGFTALQTADGDKSARTIVLLIRAASTRKSSANLRFPDLLDAKSASNL
jgi:hypothetical protein